MIIIIIVVMVITPLRKLKEILPSNGLQHLTYQSFV
jgi:hypothetical protein